MSRDLGIVIHGGVLSNFETSENSKRVPVLRAALEAGWDLLSREAPGEEAVVAALRLLEASEYFDAGYGAFPNEDGEVFLDAALMRGDGSFVSLLNVDGVMFPSEVALELLCAGECRMRVWNEKLRDWLRQSPLELQERVGLVKHSSELISPYAKSVSDYFRLNTGQQTLPLRSPGLSGSPVKGTVGCVVRDGKGTIVAGTSTGGTPAKPAGRIGDSPLIGVGTFADSNIGGLSATGHGEAIMGSLLPGFVLSGLRRVVMNPTVESASGTSEIQQVLSQELSEFGRKYPTSSVGLIVLPVSGRPVFDFIAAGMGVAARSSRGSKIDFELCEIAHK